MKGNSALKDRLDKTIVLKDTHDSNEVEAALIRQRLKIELDTSLVITLQLWLQPLPPVFSLVLPSYSMKNQTTKAVSAV